ncbi:MAG: hypothetical protein ACI89T_000964 [Cognaticolwellia sp.]|jgi:hypothetical protein
MLTNLVFGVLNLKRTSFNKELCFRHNLKSYKTGYHFDNRFIYVQDIRYNASVCRHKGIYVREGI